MEIICLRNLVQHTVRFAMFAGSQWVGYKQEIPDVSASWQGLHSQTWYMEGRQTMRNLGCGLLWFAQGLFIPADCIHLHYINCALSSKCIEMPCKRVRNLQRAIGSCCVIGNDLVINCRCFLKHLETIPLWGCFFRPNPVAST